MATNGASEVKPDQSVSGPNDEDIAEGARPRRRIDMAKPQQAICHPFRARVSKFLLCTALAAVVLSSCATHYQREGIFTNGYSDFQTSPSSFVVTFRSHEQTDPEKVLQYALRRAAEVALQHGYPYFAVIEQQGDGFKERGSARLHYPSIRLAIECYGKPPLERSVIDAKQYLIL